MSNSGTIHIALKIDDKGSVRVMQDVGRVSTETGRKGKQAFDDMDRSAKNFNGSAGLSAGALLKMGAGVVSLTAIAAGLKAVSGAAIKSASDLQEMASKYDVVFKGQTYTVNQWSANLVDKYAMSTRESKQYMASIQDLLVPMGMQATAAAKLSNEIVKLSVDLGSFNNLPTAQVMENIQSALVGEYETMKKYGVVINAALVEQEAMNLKLAETKDLLTAADKAQAAYSLIVKASTAATGDMARTSDGYANTTKRLNAEWEDLSATLGKKFLPVATSVKGVLADIFDSITKYLQAPTIDDYVSKLQKMQKELNDLEKNSSKDPYLTIFSKQKKEQIQSLNEIIGAMNEGFKESRMFDSFIQKHQQAAPVIEKNAEETKEYTKALSDLKDGYAKAAMTAEEYGKYEIDKWYEAEAKALGGVTPKLKEVYELMLKKNQAKHEEIALEKAYKDVRDAMSANYDTSWQAELDRFDANDVKDRADALKEAYKDKVKAAEDAEDAIQKANEKALDAAKEDYKDFSGTVRDNVKDIIKSHESMADKIESIIEDMLYNIGAAILSQKFIIPMGLQIGSALGASWNGTSFSSMAGSGSKVLGMASNANSLYNSFSGGASNFFNSGLGGKVGSSLLGNSAWFGTPYFGASEFMVPATAGAAGSTAGGIAGALGTIAPYAAIAAIAIPMLINAFKKEKDPVLAFHFGENFGGSGVSDMGFSTYTQLMSPETAGAARDYFEAQFKAIDETLSISFSDVIKNRAKAADAGQDLIGTGWNPDTYGGVEATLKTASTWIAKNLAQGVAEAYGVGGLANGVNGTATDFFESILPSGSDSLFDAFVRFGQVMDKTEDSVTAFTRQLELTGEATDAFLNLEKIVGVFTGIGALVDPLITLTDPLVQIVDQFNAWEDILKDSKATLEDVTKAQEKMNTALGMQITGLSATNVGNSISGAIMGQNDIDTALNAIIGQAIAGNLATALTEDVMDTAILPFVDMVGKAFTGSDNDMVAFMEQLPSLMSQLGLGGFKQQIADFAAEYQKLFGAGGGESGFARLKGKLVEFFDEATEVVERKAAEAAELRKSHLDLYAEYNEITGNTEGALRVLNEQRRLELKELDAETAAIQKAVWGAQDRAKAEEEAARIAEEAARQAEEATARMKSIAEKSTDLQIQLLQAQGKEEEALAMQRQIEIQSLRDAFGDASGPMESILQSIYKLDDAAKALAKSMAYMDAIDSLEVRLKTEQITMLRNTGRDALADEYEQALKKFRINEEVSSLTKGMSNVNDINYIRTMVTTIYDLQDLNAAFQDVNDTVKDTVDVMQQLDDAKSAYLSGLQREQQILEDSLNKAKDNYLRLLNEELDELKDRVNIAKENYLDLLNDEYSAQEQLAESLRGAIASIKEYQKSLYSGESSPLSLGERQGTLLIQRSVLSAKAMAGDTDAVAELIPVSAEYLDVAKQMSKTSLEYAREVALTNALMEDVATSADGQLTEAESQAAVFKSLIDGVSGVEKKIIDMDEARSAYERVKHELDVSWYQAQIAVLTATGMTNDLMTANSEYFAAKAALDDSWYDEEITALQDIVLGIDELYEAYVAAASAAGIPVLGNGPQPVPVNSSSDPWSAQNSNLEMVMTAYKKAGLTPATAGIDYWMNDLASGRVSVDNFISTFNTAASTNPLSKNYRGFATGGSFQVFGASGMDNLSLPQMRVSSGEMVNITRPDVMSGMQAELRSLREEVQKLREENKIHAVAQIKSSQKIERNTGYLEEWDVEGIPAERTA